MIINEKSVNVIFNQVEELLHAYCRKIDDAFNSNTGLDINLKVQLRPDGQQTTAETSISFVVARVKDRTDISILNDRQMPLPLEPVNGSSTSGEGTKT